MKALLEEVEEMGGVREYGEGSPVMLQLVNEDSYGAAIGTGPRLTICATNECGYNCTNVDLLDLLQWVKNHRPELLKAPYMDSK